MSQIGETWNETGNYETYILYKSERCEVERITIKIGTLKIGTAEIETQDTGN